MQPKQEKPQKGSAERNALPLGEHTIYEVKYSVLYFTLLTVRNFKGGGKEMSKCAVHMMKLKMSAMGGIQSHNQREHESKKNKEIDYSKSDQNFDVLLNENINYQRTVKERIEDLNLKKAVRKDAVVYCSFIVSSDRDFFVALGEQEHINRERADRESVAVGVAEPTPFEYTSKTYQEDCMRVGAERFFERSAQFFCQRYGAENVINATVHMDEATPHMHLGVVPVTADGRLSAKDLFTPLELKQLQTDFAEKVGKTFDLERGKEGSEAKHLDEISFKVKKRQEQLERLDNEVWQLESKRNGLELNCEQLQKDAESLSKTVSDLKADISTLDTQKRLIERILARLQEYKDELTQAINKIAAKGNSVGVRLEQAKQEIRSQRALDYIERTGQAERFEDFYKTPQRAFKSPFEEKTAHRPKSDRER